MPLSALAHKWRIHVVKQLKTFLLSELLGVICFLGGVDCFLSLLAHSKESPQISFTLVDSLILLVCGGYRLTFDHYHSQLSFCPVSLALRLRSQFQFPSTYFLFTNIFNFLPVCVCLSSFFLFSFLSFFLSFSFFFTVL